MDNDSPILLIYARIPSLLHSRPIYPEVLEDVQDYLRRAENFLHRCSGTPSSDRGLDAGDPHASDVSVASDRISTEEPQHSADFQITVSSHDNLPILLPNIEFDNLPIESNLISAITVTTSSQFFDYTLYAADQRALVEVTQ